MDWSTTLLPSLALYEVWLDSDQRLGLLVLPKPESVLRALAKPNNLLFEGPLPMPHKKSTVVFTCKSYEEAELIHRAVGGYRCVLREAGIDPHNYAPANAEGAGFGWDTVHQAARDMHCGSRTYMSARIATALKIALQHHADHGQAKDSARARALATRMNDAISAAAN